jgi:hypothetical protein
MLECDTRPAPTCERCRQPFSDHTVGRVQHEDYRLHVFEKGHDCRGTTLKNWLFVIPDGVSADPAAAAAAAEEEDDEAVATPDRAAPMVLNRTNLRAGNLRQEHQPSAQACARSCAATAGAASVASF